MTSVSYCAECGASYTGSGVECADRFNALLALDHSREEPWGSRHGQAFAAFALQHPARYASSLDRAWAALCQIYVEHQAPDRVFATLVAHPGSTPVYWNVPVRAERLVAAPSVTIADLADFAAQTYPERLDAWCRASLASWGLIVELPTGGVVRKPRHA